MSELLFYEKPVALNREAHKKLKFQPVADLSFSKAANSVPVSGIEFFEASRDMTVLFSKAEAGDYFPLVLLSLRSSGHELVDKDGKWQGNYIPSFIRRYPFVLSKEGTVCLDSKSPSFSEKKGDSLFDAEGKSTETLDRIVAFLQQFEQEMTRTRAFCEALAEREMFTPFQAQVSGGEGKPVRLQGLYTVDQKKFSELKGETLEQWFSRGWIGWIYAHLHSIGALRRLPRDVTSGE